VTAPGRGRARAIEAASYFRALGAALRRVPPEERAREGPHAQFGEDRILERIFSDQGHGYCVEVGAYDGRTGSASYLFEQKGWDCLLVEPIPGLADEIRRHRRSVVRNCAVSAQEGEATFYVAEDVEQMSTLVLTPGHQEWIHDAGGAVTTITVPTTRLDTLLAEVGFPRIDFITIDVEGHESEVLRGFSLEKHRPRVVILEDNAEEGQSTVSRYMAECGYLNFKRTGVNEWYAHRSDTELVQLDAVRQFQREKAIRRFIERHKSRVARRLPSEVKRRSRA
jgi:FkbM family methyltransferase